MKLLSKLNVTKATGCDNISARFLKDASNVIVNPLTYIVNLSIKTGIVPDDFKTARVVPLFKKGDCNLESNYRPVSILPVISKLFERIVFDQFNNYLVKKDLIYKYQSGFRPSFSTDTALTYFTDRVRFNIDNGLYTGVILLDLRKAFDTVNHSILLKKLESIGVDDNAVKWFCSYLIDRKQFVDVSGTYSSCDPIVCGVPQGSILGPLLFSIYVNDMVSATSASELFLYADDSMVVVSSDSIQVVERTLSLEIEQIKLWLDSNKLSLHLGKTESIVFASKSKLKKVAKLKITCNGTEIESKDKVKYLGVVIDQDLSGTSLGNNIIKKVNSCLKFLYRKRVFLKFKERKLLSNAILQSRFDYGINVYFRNVNQNIKIKIQTAQNKMIRFILGHSPRKHLTFNDFRAVKMLSMKYRIEYLNLNFTYNIMHNVAPDYLCESFNKIDHRYSTKYSNNSFVIPSVKSQGKKSFVYNSIKDWNSLPLSIRVNATKNNFKIKLKDHLFTTMEKEENDIYVYY